MSDNHEFSWQFERTDAGVVVVMSGVIDERANLVALASTIKEPVTFDLAGIVRISSYGAQLWIRFMSQLSGRVTSSLRRCSPAFVAQLNMLPNFSGSAHILSVMGPYLCLSTDEETIVEIPIQGGKPLMPPAVDQKTGEALRFDDNPQRFFSFLKLS